MPLIDESDRVVASVAGERAELGRFVGAFGETLDVIASRRAALGETVKRAPATLAATRRALTALEGAAIPLPPVRARAPRDRAAADRHAERAARLRRCRATDAARGPPGFTDPRRSLGGAAPPWCRTCGRSPRELSTFSAALQTR